MLFYLCANRLLYLDMCYLWTGVQLSISFDVELIKVKPLSEILIFYLPIKYSAHDSVFK
jgi:hypothetical protein